MLERFKEIIESEFDGFINKEIFLAISGGKDSMTLSSLLLKSNIPHTLLHCNFQLRGQESNLDEAFLQEYAVNNNLPIQIERFDTTNEASIRNLTIQETARNLRYDWFQSICKNENQLVLTAHHLDDSIETFFINLMRGTGIKGLTGIPKRNKHIRRPLLSFSTEEIVQFVEQNQIPFRADKSNADNKYLRNELRNNIIPLLNNKTDKFKAKAGKTINSLFETHLWIEEQAQKFISTHFIKDPKGVYQINKEIIQKEKSIFLEYVLKQFGLHRSNLESFTLFLSAQTGSKFHTSEYSFSIDQSNLYIYKEESINRYSQLIDVHQIPTIINVNYESYSFKLINEILPFGNDKLQQISLSNISFPVCIRNWNHSDKIQPLGMAGSKLLSDLLVDKKVPLHERNSILVLEDSNNVIIAVLGIAISDQFKINTPEEPILLIQTSIKQTIDH